MRERMQSRKVAVAVGVVVVAVAAASANADVFECSEQGILDAIDAGGGPHTFSCEGETTVETSAEIEIDTPVILDGEGKLTVDGGRTHRVFHVGSGVTAELRQMTVSRGNGEGSRISGNGGGILTEGAPHGHGQHDLRQQAGGLGWWDLRLRYRELGHDQEQHPIGQYC